MQGFAAVGFKSQFRKSSTCMTDGMSLTMGMAAMTLKSMMTASEDDEENMGDVIVDYFRKCNGMDTIQGTILTNFITNRATSSSLNVIKVPAYMMSFLDWA